MQANQADTFTPWRATKFYFPQVLQAFSQSLTYPLVGSIVAHGADGVAGYTAFAQGQIVMFMVGALGCGLITTGMVHGRDKEGFRQFCRLNSWIAVVMFFLQLLVCAPPLDVLVFQKILGLQPELARVARNTMLFGQVMQFAFFMRNVPFVALFNAKNSAAANVATLCRIALTAALSPLFRRIGWVGPSWGVVAMTGPVLLEMALGFWMARPYIRALQNDNPAPSSLTTQLAFTLPLSIGGILLAMAPFMVGVFIGHAADPVRMFAIHAVSIGVANPLGFAALRMQSVVIAYPPRFKGDRAVLGYALIAGAALGTCLLVCQIPAVGRWYFCGVQNLPETDLPLARRVIALYLLLPLLQSMRGYFEGVAAWLRCPNAILSGQATNLGALVLMLELVLRLHVPGYLMGVSAILFAIFMTCVVVRIGIACRHVGK
ncbi:MAG: hypothetical protein J5985_06135 [Kiritimatiellae bacterium]|nr:hypothetical protein [Kiritimatiellia bacterium]